MVRLAAARLTAYTGCCVENGEKGAAVKEKINQQITHKKSHKEKANAI